jgi:plasmid stabilization system protein ParE
MQAAKQDALNTINQLPEAADMEEIMYRLYVLDKVRKGQKDVDHAKADLRHIHDFIAADSRHYAKKVSQGIVDKTLQLSELPHIGKVVPEIDNEDIRELHMYSYRILYAIKADHTHVLAIVPKRQDFQAEDLP